MNSIKRYVRMNLHRQTGTTLIVALVLLLLASLLGLFAMNVGLFAQRTSAADMRARIVHETLEAALSQGVEYIKNNRTTLIDPSNPTSSTYWTACDHTDTSFPCGTVPPCVAGHEGCASGSTFARRSNMYYYSAGAGYDVNGNGNTTDALDTHSLPIASAQRISASNGYSVNYGVGTLMCMVKRPAAVADPAECTTTTTNAQGTYLFTVTAVGKIPTESASTTLSMTFGESPRIPGAVNAPTIVASASVDLTGNGTFVTDPNGGGNGLPITVWSRGPVTQGGVGTVNTCFYEDWIRTANGVNGGSTYGFATNSDGTTSTIVTCSGNGNKACACSQSISDGQGKLSMGSDILTNDSGTISVCPTGYPTCKPNYDVQPSEFPCDLFQYIFGTQAWTDSDGDNFCETRLPKVTATLGSAGPQSVNVDEAFLYASAVLILDANAAHAGWATSGQTVASCAALIAATSSSSFTGGIVWDRTGACKLTGQIGWPDKPVAWVGDGNADLQGATLYGLVFVRDTSDPTAPAGGAATFTSHSTGTIYGSVVVQGTGSKLNGSSAVVYNGAVLRNLANLPATNPASPVPGSWTDRYVY